MIFLILFLTLLLQKHLDAIHYSLLVFSVDQLYIQGPCKCVTPGLHSHHQDSETMIVITCHLRSCWNVQQETYHALSAPGQEMFYLSHNKS